MNESFQYRLALLVPDADRIVTVVKGGSAVLPQMSIRADQRIVPQLLEFAFEQWQLRAIFLDIIDEGSNIPCAILEVRTNPSVLKGEDIYLSRIGDVAEPSLTEFERVFLKSMLHNAVPEQQPLTKIGWIDDARYWIEETIDSRLHKLTGEFTQLNGGRGFSLVRFHTTVGPAIWFKAVGTPNLREFSITAFLSEECPRYLPAVVAMRKDWHAWAMVEFGSPSCASRTVEAFERDARTLAELQIALIGRDSELVRVGCGDHRIGVLDSHIDDAFAYLAEIMPLQTSARAERLSYERLATIQLSLHSACLVMSAQGIPSSVLHGDFSAANVLSDGKTTAFTDWADARVGNPFITFEQFNLRIARAYPDRPDWIARLQDCYRSCWVTLLPRRSVVSAQTLAPLISMLSALCGLGVWPPLPHRDDPRVQGLARSIVRSMSKAMTAPDVQELLC